MSNVDGKLVITLNSPAQWLRARYSPILPSDRQSLGGVSGSAGISMILFGNATDLGVEQAL